MPIILSELTSLSGPGVIHWNWILVDPNKDGLPYLRVEAVEMWVSLSDNRNAAFKIGEGLTDFVQQAPVDVTFFGWIKARQRNGDFSDWHPDSLIGGVIGKVFVPIVIP